MSRCCDFFFHLFLPLSIFSSLWNLLNQLQCFHNDFKTKQQKIKLMKKDEVRNVSELVILCCTPLSYYHCLFIVHHLQNIPTPSAPKRYYHTQTQLTTQQNTQKRGNRKWVHRIHCMLIWTCIYRIHTYAHIKQYITSHHFSHQVCHMHFGFL